ncbi:hypothetical protein FA95DRAFT_1607834 [Auriscalpium vulgare]|uniref:Uncharacterized protein n=1 Tax=Auriscalpium vulgare TaxID=40419 RepID=A0ACB8RNQ2_9AGAM|nr:hypothetical protein FA95DRAFT_1607834 [Auriscalpium vulgare]
MPQLYYVVDQAMAPGVYDDWAIVQTIIAGSNRYSYRVFDKVQYACLAWVMERFPELHNRAMAIPWARHVQDHVLYSAAGQGVSYLQPDRAVEDPAGVVEDPAALDAPVRAPMFTASASPLPATNGATVTTVEPQSPTAGGPSSPRGNSPSAIGMPSPPTSAHQPKRRPPLMIAAGQGRKVAKPRKTLRGSRCPEV